MWSFFKRSSQSGDNDGSIVQYQGERAFNAAMRKQHANAETRSNLDQHQSSLALQRKNLSWTNNDAYSPSSTLHEEESGLVVFQKDTTQALPCRSDNHCLHPGAPSPSGTLDSPILCQPIMNKSISSPSSATSRSSVAPKIMVVPHKVIVLDREKAMRDNPNLKRKDFVSLGNKNYKIPRGQDLKVILVVGESGAGKTTTINSLVNFLWGVQYIHEHRLQLIVEPVNQERKSKSQSQTDQVVGYLLEKPPAMSGKSLLIIDTPGFGDTRGFTRDDQTIAEIKAFFDLEVDHLDAISFVIKGTDNRLSYIRRWIFDQVLGLFGRDVARIITLLMTFSDASEPPALQVVQDAGIEHSQVFKLNNSAFFIEKLADTGQMAAFNRMFWELGYMALASFVHFVYNQPPQRLDMTRQVLDQRESLKCEIGAIQSEVQRGMDKLDDLEKTIMQVVRCEEVISTNQEFHYYVTLTKRVKRPKVTAYNTVCDTCKWTCHHDCQIAQDASKAGCWAMNDSSGYCNICPGKCHWSDHKNLDYYWDGQEYKERRTNKELETRYFNANSEKSKYEQIVDGLFAEFDQTQEAVAKAIQKVRQLINRLNEIALRPNVLHEDEYFDMMIDQERKEKRRGWQDRVVMIAALKQRSAFMAQVNQHDYDPFEERRRKIQDILTNETTTISSKFDMLHNMMHYLFPQVPIQAPADITESHRRRGGRLIKDGGRSTNTKKRGTLFMFA